MSEYGKENDYTLRVISDVPGGGILTRYFNFASQEVTSILIATHEKADRLEGGYIANRTVSTSVSAAISSNMNTRSFSQFDSWTEINLMKKILLEKDGVIPENEVLDKQMPPALNHGLK